MGWKSKFKKKKKQCKVSHLKEKLVFSWMKNGEFEGKTGFLFPQISLKVMEHSSHEEEATQVTIGGWTDVVWPHGALLLSLKKENCGTSSTWMDRGDIALSEMSPSQKDKYS